MFSCVEENEIDGKRVGESSQKASQFVKVSIVF